MPYVKPRWKPRLRRSFALPAPGLSVSPCLATRPPHEILVSWPANFIRGDAICEATLEAPAQAELRPTCAGAFRVILPCNATPDEILVSLPANFIRGDAICEATREAPAQAELRPTCAGAFRIILACDATPATRDTPVRTEPHPTYALSGNTLDGQDNYVKGKRTFNSPQPSNEQLP